MKEQSSVPHQNDIGPNDKKNAPNAKVKEQDEKQQDEIFRTADNLKGCLVVVVAVIIAYFCYSLYANSQNNNTTKPKTEIVKHKN